jgi:transposase-like protein
MFRQSLCDRFVPLTPNAIELLAGVPVSSDKIFGANYEALKSAWQWHLDEVFVKKINGERFYLWRAVDHEGEVLECFVTKRRNKAAAKKFLIKTMRKHGSPNIITTDKLPSYGAVLRETGVVDRQLCGGRSTTDAKIRTCHFDGESEQCSYLKQQPRSRGLSVITVKYTTTSIMKDIFKTDRLINKNTQPLSRSGTISVPHDD